MDEEISSTLLMLILISDKRKLVCSWKLFKKSFVDSSAQTGNRDLQKFDAMPNVIGDCIEVSQFFALEV